jgi:hypothetical protein
MLEKNIIVIDDFYENPSEVRQFALTREYPTPGTHTYPGKNSVRSHDGIWYNDQIHAKIESAIGRKVIPQNIETTGGDCGYFRTSLAADSFEQDIHVDPNSDWGGVLFLNVGSQCDPESGTSFWRHKKFGSEYVPMNPKEGQVYNFGDYEDIRKNIIYGDGLDRSLWDRYCFVPMKFNRLVLFSPYLWHSHGNNFGNTIENGRLVQLFFYSNAK